MAERRPRVLLAGAPVGELTAHEAPGRLDDAVDGPGDHHAHHVLGGDRVAEDAEREGLDIASHGESAYEA